MDSSASPISAADASCWDRVRLRPLFWLVAADACGAYVDVLALAGVVAPVPLMDVLGCCGGLGCSVAAAGWGRGRGIYMLSSSDDSCTMF